MPKKGKKNKTKTTSSEEDEGPCLDEVQIWTLNFLELQQHTQALYTAIRKEREDRNFFQVERYKILKYLVIYNRQIIKNREKLRKFEGTLKELDINEGVDTRREQEKNTELEYKNSLEIREKSYDSAVALVKQKELLSSEEKQLRNDNNGYRRFMEDMENRKSEIHTQMDIRQAQTLTNARERNLEAVEYEVGKRHVKYGKAVNSLKKSCQASLKGLNNRKKEEFNSIMASHTNDLADMKQVYENIISHNFVIVNCLRGDLNKLKHDEITTLKAYREATLKNEYLKTRIKKMRARSEEIKRLMKTTAADRQELADVKQKLNMVRMTIDQTHIEVELLMMEKDKVEVEHRALKERFQRQVSSLLLNVGRKTICNYMGCQCLERMIDAFKRIQNVLEDRFSLKQALLEGRYRTKAQEKLERMTDKYNNVRLAHGNLLNIYDRIMKELGFNYSDIGFEPRRNIWDKSRSSMKRNLLKYCSERLDSGF